ncbi:hypothetical protein Tco_0870099 [Tanacetum coccineum]
MIVADGNIMHKTPQEAYDLIENMTQHQFQWDAEVYYDTTTGVSARYSETTFALSAQIEVLEKQIAYISQNLQHEQGPGHPNTVEYTYSNESDEDEPSEAYKSEIDPLIRESTDIFSIGDNPIFVIQNEESDESETETIIKEVQIHSSQSTAQIPPPIPYDREDYCACFQSSNTQSRINCIIISISVAKQVLWGNRLSFPDGSLPLSRKCLKGGDEDVGGFGCGGGRSVVKVARHGGDDGGVGGDEVSLVSDICKIRRSTLDEANECKYSTYLGSTRMKS